MPLAPVNQPVNVAEPPSLPMVKVAPPIFNSPSPERLPIVSLLPLRSNTDVLSPTVTALWSGITLLEPESFTVAPE